MFKPRLVSADTYYVGASEHDNFLFENVYPLEHGVSYNSYVILDKKTCLLDSVDRKVADEFIEKVEITLNGRPLDYLIVNHMEPDHSASLKRIIDLYPNVTVVLKEDTLDMFRNFNRGYAPKNILLVKEFDTLNLGKHTLTFVYAPMVHWPEVMMTYDVTTKTLFSADAFGMFGALNGNLFADEYDFERVFLDDARRYYTNIVGKYGIQVQQVLKKAATIQIDTICPLHGPIWRHELNKLITLYDKWSKYEPEVKGVLVLVGSIYGNMLSNATRVVESLSERGVKEIALYDVAQKDKSFLLSECFKYSHILIMSSTYNMGIFTPVEDLLNDLILHKLESRKYAIVEGGSWSPNAGSLIKEMMDKLSDCTQVGETVTIMSSYKNEDEKKLNSIVDALVNDLDIKKPTPNALFNISYGLYVLTTRDGDKDNGCIINTFNQVANTPDRVMISVNKNNYSADIIKKTKKCVVNIINKDADFNLFVRFGFHTGKEVDKFEGFNDVKRLESGILALTKQVNSYVEIEVTDVLGLGTHYGFIGVIKNAEVLNDVESVTYSYYQSNIKPKPNPNEKKKKGWVCKVCGYVYEGEELPPDFVCPLCKHPASDFEKI